MTTETSAGGALFIAPLNTSPTGAGLTRTQRRARRRWLLQQLREQRRGQHRDAWSYWRALGVTTDV